MAFKLSIVNTPEGSYWWKGRYNGNDVDSDWIRIGTPWHCPYDANGATDLDVLVYTQDFWHQLHRKDNLGPIYDGKEYTYDCQTEVLTEGPYVPVPAEIRDVTYWSPTLGIYVTDPPEVQAGSECGVRCNAVNLSAGYLYLRSHISIWDSFGNGVKGSTVGPSGIAPGGSLGNFCRVVAAIPGTYTANIELFVGETFPGELIESIQDIPIANVLGELPPLSGYLCEPQIYDATTGESFYSHGLPAEIEGGHEVLAIVHWKNDGGEPAVFTAILELVDPDGVVRASYTDIRPLEPGDDNGCQTPYTVELDKEGTWKIHATLEVEGVLLDEKIWDAILTTGVPPEFKGTITKKELEYDEERGLIPIIDIPVGVAQRGLIHITGRNDTATHQMVGVFWVVTDPDGNWVDRYGPDWEGMTAGEEDDFIGGRFDLDKVGTYNIKVNLLMNPDDPEVVDSYDAVLCTTTPEMPPEYVLLEETIYPYAYVYDGPCDIFTFTFTSIPFTPASWEAGKLAADYEDEVKKAGGRVMEMRVYVDEHLLRPWTNWRIEIIGTSPAGAAGLGISIGIGFWVQFIIFILGLIGVMIVASHFIIKPLTYKHKGLTPALKEPMSRDTLIGLINDFEVKLIEEGKIPGPPTPPEELEEMSDQGLRDYCDQLAETIAPTEPEFPWPWVIIGGVAVLGVGAAVALAARR